MEYFNEQTQFMLGIDDNFRDFLVGLAANNIGLVLESMDNHERDFDWDKKSKNDKYYYNFLYHYLKIIPDDIRYEILNKFINIHSTKSIVYQNKITNIYDRHRKVIKEYNDRYILSREFSAYSKIIKGDDTGETLQREIALNKCAFTSTLEAGADDFYCKNKLLNIMNTNNKFKLRFLRKRLRNNKSAHINASGNNAAMHTIIYENGQILHNIIDLSQDDRDTHNVHIINLHVLFLRSNIYRYVAEVTHTNDTYYLTIACNKYNTQINEFLTLTDFVDNKQKFYGNERIILLWMLNGRKLPKHVYNNASALFTKFSNAGDTIFEFIYAFLSNNLTFIKNCLENFNKRYYELKFVSIHVEIYILPAVVKFASTNYSKYKDIYELLVQYLIYNFRRAESFKSIFDQSQHKNIKHLFHHERISLLDYFMKDDRIDVREIPYDVNRDDDKLSLTIFLLGYGVDHMKILKNLISNDRYDNFVDIIAKINPNSSEVDDLLYYALFDQFYMNKVEKNYRPYKTNRIYDSEKMYTLCTIKIIQYLLSSGGTIKKNIKRKLYIYVCIMATIPELAKEYEIFTLFEECIPRIKIEIVVERAVGVPERTNKKSIRKKYFLLSQSFVKKYFEYYPCSLSDYLNCFKGIHEYHKHYLCYSEFDTVRKFFDIPTNTINFTRAYFEALNICIDCEYFEHILEQDIMYVTKTILDLNPHLDVYKIIQSDIINDDCDSATLKYFLDKLFERDYEHYQYKKIFDISCKNNYNDIVEHILEIFPDYCISEENVFDFFLMHNESIKNNRFTKSSKLFAIHVANRALFDADYNNYIQKDYQAFRGIDLVINGISMKKYFVNLQMQLQLHSTRVCN